MNVRNVAARSLPTNLPAYDPYSYRIHADPYPTYAWMREHAPVYRNDERDFWALSRYEDVASALRDPGLFSSRNGISLEPDLWGPEAVRTSFLLAMDPPDHRVLRRLVGDFFKPRWVARLEPRIRELARARLGPLLERATFDFAADYAAALPSDVMCELVGIPPADRDWIRTDNDLLNHCQDGSEQRSSDATDAGLRLALYYATLINQRRRRPGDDLTSSMIAARVDGKPLTDAQLVAFLFLMVSVTNESTGKEIGLAWYYGAMFANPDTFDLDRDTSAMLSFGRGPHFCLGAALAQLEIAIALEEMGALVSSYEVDLDGVRHIHSAQQRGFSSLPCTVNIRATSTSR